MQEYVQSNNYKISNSSILYDYPCSNTDTCHGHEVKLHKGYWKLECWGASGGDGYNPTITKTFSGGLGGYSIGVIYLERETTMYITVGGKGISNYSGIGHFSGGFNGGGYGHVGSYGYPCGSGGGSSDIRMCGNTVDHRILVAGGGGGAGASNVNLKVGVFGGHGGGLEGLKGGGWKAEYDENSGNGGTQTSGGSGGYNVELSYNQFGEDGSLLFGGSGMLYNVSIQGSSGGGGGGYYGGGGSAGAGAGGGSGYIGGVISGFGIKAKTLSGKEKFPSPYGGFETGHLGNGFVRIKYIDLRLYSCFSKKNINLLMSLISLFIS